MKVDYFGYDRDGRRGHGWNPPCDYSYHDHPMGGVDGVYAPRVGEKMPRHKYHDSRPEEPQGRAALVRVNAYTAIAYWDRSGDERPNSNSVFAAAGEHTFEELLAAAKEQWAWVFARQAFGVTQRDQQKGLE